jgi:DNA-binding transcriptional ArsR family regulator
MHTEDEFRSLASDFHRCRAVLAALGDENRLHILYQMMITAKPTGMRVGEIVRMSNLSRPAVSHHMKILKDAGVINVRREGTKNFYYLDPDMKSFKILISVLQRSVDYAAELPYRGEE